MLMQLSVMVMVGRRRIGVNGPTTTTVVVGARRATRRFLPVALSLRLNTLSTSFSLHLEHLADFGRRRLTLAAALIEIAAIDLESTFFL